MNSITLRENLDLAKEVQHIARLKIMEYVVEEPTRRTNKTLSLMRRRKNTKEQ